jgi:hypothetical protein
MAHAEISEGVFFCASMLHRFGLPYDYAKLEEFTLPETFHLRRDMSRPGDVYAVGNGMHKKDTVMDLMITSTLKQSCLLQSTKGSDYVIRKAESVKFRPEARSNGPIQSSSTRRLVPLALNRMGLRGSHFAAVLKEFATILVTRPGGCALLQGPFALSINGALLKILNTSGSRLTWIAHVELDRAL